MQLFSTQCSAMKVLMYGLAIVLVVGTAAWLLRLALVLTD